MRRCPPLLLTRSRGRRARLRLTGSRLAAPTPPLVLMACVPHVRVRACVPTCLAACPCACSRAHALRRCGLTGRRSCSAPRGPRACSSWRRTSSCAPSRSSSARRTWRPRTASRRCARAQAASSCTPPAGCPGPAHHRLARPHCTHIAARGGPGAARARQAAAAAAAAAPLVARQPHHHLCAVQEGGAARGEPAAAGRVEGARQLGRGRACAGLTGWGLRLRCEQVLLKPESAAVLLGCTRGHRVPCCRAQAAAIHGDINQAQRTAAVDGFKSGKVGACVGADSGGCDAQHQRVLGLGRWLVQGPWHSAHAAPPSSPCCYCRCPAGPAAHCHGRGGARA